MQKNNKQTNFNINTVHMHFHSLGWIGWGFISRWAPCIPWLLLTDGQRNLWSGPVALMKLMKFSSESPVSIVTSCESFLLFMPLYYFVWLCMIVYNPLLHRMTTDYVWLCKTLLDTVWLCMTLYDSDWMNQYLKHWPFFTHVYSI